ncbi:MAG: NAD(P)-dependent oxidoreductase [Bacteroidota bacterium]
MRIFITGATGFIGQHLCKRLVAEGHDLTVLLRSPKKRNLLPKGVTFLNGDLSLFKDHNLVLPKFDYVIHLAGAIFAKNRVGYFEINFEGVKDLVTCLQNQDWQLKRFLFASSLAAAGPSNGEVPHIESDPLNPRDPYGEAKKAAEEWLQAQEIPSTSFRPAIVLGPGDENTYTLFKMAKKGLGIKVAGIDQQLSFVDVDDVVDALIKMMTIEGDLHQTYFIAHPEEITLPELWRQLANAFSREVWLILIPQFLLFFFMILATAIYSILPFKNQLDYKQYRQMTGKAFVCSSQKLTDELGWTPKFDLKASLAKAIEGYKALGKL